MNYNSPITTRTGFVSELGVKMSIKIGNGGVPVGVNIGCVGGLLHSLTEKNWAHPFVITQTIINSMTLAWAPFPDREADWQAGHEFRVDQTPLFLSATPLKRR